MAKQTTFQIPAITAGTPQTRSFDGLRNAWPYPYRTRLDVYNRTTATLIVQVNGRGEPMRVGGGDQLIVEREGPIYFYTIDASANTSANEAEVFENGGLDTSYEEEVAVEAS